MPVDGVPYQAFYLARLASPDAVAARRAQVQEAARAAGVEIRVRQNRSDAQHARRARTPELGDSADPAFEPAALIDRLFTGYFIDGEDIGDLATLERLGLACGLDAAGLAGHLATSRRADDMPLPGSPESAGVRGVPHFVVDSTWALSGAHSPGVIVDAMLRAVCRSLKNQEDRGID